MPRVTTKEALQEFGPLVFATGAAAFQLKTALYIHPGKTKMDPPQNRWFVDFFPVPKFQREHFQVPAVSFRECRSFYGYIWSSPSNVGVLQFELSNKKTVVGWVI